MNVDRELIEKTEALMWPESPPEPPKMQWSGRCRWMALFFILLAGLGLWQQIWFFFGVGVLGECVLVVLSLQFRLEVERLFSSHTGAKAHPLLPVGAFAVSNPKPFSLQRDGSKAPSSSLDRLKLHWDPEAKRTFRAGQGGDVALLVQAPPTRLVLTELQLRHSVYMEASFHPAMDERIALSPFQERTLSIQVKTPVIGKFRLFGVEMGLEDTWGLFRTYRYQRAPLMVRVLPAIPLRRIDRQGYRLRVMMREQTGAPQRRAGAGTELRDIRDYQAGDARRNIVWKHSVRLQKLLCREFESETLMSSYLILDIGQSMRQGVPGSRPIDYASEVVAAFSKASLDARDAVGLISYDGEIYRHDMLSTGQKQLQKILLHLEELPQMTEPKFAYMRLSHLAAWVGSFLYREGLLSRQGGQMAPSNHQTVAYIWDLVWRHPDLNFPKKWDSDRDLVEVVLRLFCKVVGIELPYRYHEWVTQKVVGLQTSLEHASNSLHAGQMIAVLSDMDDIIHWDGLVRTIKLIRQRRQHLVFLSPFSPWFEHEGAIRDTTQDKMLREIFTLEQWRRRRRLERLTGKWGIPILSMEPSVAPAALLKRLQRLRLGGRL
ncbi:MAG: DUF58 domain-containing protein [Deltaproteobacteria bacterium]|nr:MAG: DUF58 domain-containing protein [Deltaproteobacteria bacterium]